MTEYDRDEAIEILCELTIAGMSLEDLQAYAVDTVMYDCDKWTDIEIKEELERLRKLKL